MSDVIFLSNVRLSFPALWQARTGPDANSKPSFQAAFILDKKDNAKDIETVRATIAAIGKESFKGKLPPKVCLREGTEKGDVDGYGEGVMFINARSDKRPHVVDRDLSPLSEEDGKVYAGCYVNATVRLWAQDNQFGKRVNASLLGVQHVKDGERLSGGGVAAADDFEAIQMPPPAAGSGGGSSGAAALF
jgi:hypothetical protein